MDLATFSDAATSERGLVVVATSRADGTIQSSVVNAGVVPHPVSRIETIAFVTYGPAKLAHLRARPWATVTVRSGWRWVTVEGTVEMAGPDDPLPGLDDAELPGLLRTIFTAAGGTHDDWEAFDEVMVRESRAAVLLTPGRIYGV